MGKVVAINTMNTPTTQPASAQTTYAASLMTMRHEARIFRAAQVAYRTRKIGDAAFLRARARLHAAERAADEAENTFKASQAT